MPEQRTRIVGRHVVEDDWTLLLEDEAPHSVNGRAIVPLAQWQAAPGDDVAPLLASGFVGTAEDPQPALYAVGLGLLVVSTVVYYVVAVGYGRQLLAGGTPESDSAGERVGD